MMLDRVHIAGTSWPLHADIGNRRDTCGRFHSVDPTIDFRPTVMQICREVLQPTLDSLNKCS